MLPVMPLWLRPKILFLALTLLAIAAFLLTPASAFQDYFLTRKYVDPEALIVISIGIMTFILGSFLADFSSPSSVTKEAYEASVMNAESYMRLIGKLSLALGLIAYVVFFGMSSANAGTFMAAISGERGAIYDLKDSFELIPGVTSLINLLPWFFMWLAYKVLILNQRLSRMEVLLATGLVFATLVRGFATNERRAIIELLFPALIFVLLYGGFYRTILFFKKTFIPLSAAGLFLLFFVTEYFRTWLPVHQFTFRGISYLEYTGMRLGGYYTTAVNNATVMFQNDIESNGVLSFSGFYRFPILSDIGGLKDRGEQYVINIKDALDAYANEEFNNISGLLTPFIDFGLVGGAIVFFAFGFLASLMFNAVRRGLLIYFPIYAIFMFSIFEMPRLFHIGMPIGVINILFLLVMLAFYRRPRQAFVASTDLARQ